MEDVWLYFLCIARLNAWIVHDYVAWIVHGDFLVGNKIDVNIMLHG